MNNLTLQTSIGDVYLSHYRYKIYLQSTYVDCVLCFFFFLS